MFGGAPRYPDWLGIGGPYPLGCVKGAIEFFGGLPCLPQHPPQNSRRRIVTSIEMT